jgi:hypothetical protein
MYITAMMAMATREAVPSHSTFMDFVVGCCLCTVCICSRPANEAVYQLHWSDDKLSSCKYLKRDTTQKKAIKWGQERWRCSTQQLMLSDILIAIGTRDFMLIIPGIVQKMLPLHVVGQHSLAKK